MGSRSSSWSNRLLAAALKHRGVEEIAMSALLTATELLGRVIGRRTAQMRESALPHNVLGAKIEEVGLQNYLLRESNEILLARIQKIPDRHRPHYTPELRYRIVRLKKLLCLSQKETARRFGLCPDTIGNWEEFSRAALPLLVRDNLAIRSGLPKHPDPETPIAPLHLFFFARR